MFWMPCRTPVWVFVGKDSAFIDTPYFYFSNQIPNIENAIDIAVPAAMTYICSRQNGHLTTCTFSRLAEAPTRCVDPAIYRNFFPAHQDLDIFAQAHFTQALLTNPPNSVVLLLDSENQSVFRFSARSLELQNQIDSYAGQGNPFESGPYRSNDRQPQLRTLPGNRRSGLLRDKSSLIFTRSSSEMIRHAGPESLYFKDLDMTIFNSIFRRRKASPLAPQTVVPDDPTVPPQLTVLKHSSLSTILLLIKHRAKNFRNI